MAALGILPYNPLSILTDPRVIYRAPPKAASTPATSAPVTVSTRPPLPAQPRVLTPPTSVFPVSSPTDTGGNAPAQPVTPFGAAAPPPTTATGATTGTQTGSTGTSDTSRLLDLIAAAFQPQAVSQSLAPQSVADTSTGTSGGTNPLALVILAVAVVAGIFWYTTHKKKKAA